jgi:predicted N-formylglutamate amidohydrolase
VYEIIREGAINTKTYDSLRASGNGGMGALRQNDVAQIEPVAVSNRAGKSRFVILCDHASNFVPPEFGTLGLPRADLKRHIAWDPGALPVSARLAEMLDAPLVESRVSRLVIDCNRPPDAPDLVTPLSETTEIPGNAGLDAAAIERRLALFYRPYHTAIETLISERLAAGLGCWLVAVHSFTRVYRDMPRPWQVGVIHDSDERLAAPLIQALLQTGQRVGINQPYSPADRVYHTLERHGRARGLPCAMIEIRNDQIADDASQKTWAARLALCLDGIRLQGRAAEHV